MSWDAIKSAITRAGVDTFKANGLVTYLPKGGGALEIPAVKRREWVEIQAGNGIPISGYQTVLDIALADLPASPDDGDHVTVDGVEYRILDCQEDGGGGAMLVLNKA